MSTRIANTLLAGLPRKVYQDLLADLAPVELAFAQILYEPGRPMPYVYFPETCVVSLLVVVDERAALEVALAGREGMVGVPLALGVHLSPLRALVQAEGAALRMSRVRFRAALDTHEPLRRAVYGYAGSLMGQIGQTAACNRFHQVNARLARWLLMTRDRLECSEFRVTQEFLSAMLGVRRVGVTEAASAFQHQHLIEYSRGVIKILDHAGLEAACCSCYSSDSIRAGALAKWRPPSRSAHAAAGLPPAKTVN
jgi:CRP-like cAMP-binding protein